MEPKYTPEEELDFAREALRNSERNADFPSVVVRECYFACHRAAIAILTFQGDPDRSHGGVETSFVEIATQSGLFPKDLIVELGILRKQRIVADYGTIRYKTISRNQALYAISTTKRFISATADWIEIG